MHTKKEVFEFFDEKISTSSIAKDGDDWVLNGQKIFTTSAHFADWYWVGARTNPDVKKHFGISLFLIRMDDPGLTIHPMPTMGGERTNGVFFDDVFVHQDYMVGEENKGFQYIAEALANTISQPSIRLTPSPTQ